MDGSLGADVGDDGLDGRGTANSDARNLVDSVNVLASEQQTATWVKPHMADTNSLAFLRE